ncbi:MAG: hypothetical protein AB1650_06495 [Candidatus Omnitrophota bacterium]
MPLSVNHVPGLFCKLCYQFVPTLKPACRQAGVRVYQFRHPRVKSNHFSNSNIEFERNIFFRGICFFPENCGKNIYRHPRVKSNHFSNSNIEFERNIFFRGICFFPENCGKNIYRHPRFLKTVPHLS